MKTGFTVLCKYFVKRPRFLKTCITEYLLTDKVFVDIIELNL